MRRLWLCLVVAVGVATTAALTAAGAVPKPIEVAAGARPSAVPPSSSVTSPAASGEPEPHELDDDSQADEYFTGGQGPPVYDQPSHSFDDPAWEACDPGPGPYPSEWDGCDPFGGAGDAYHYDKPYGRSPGDALAFVLWEPGRFERAGQTFFAGRGYYQSDRWRGPVSWDDAGYADPEARCGGYYAENVRVWSGPGRDIPLPLPFPLSTPEITLPVPFTDQGWGVQGCVPR